MFNMLFSKLAEPAVKEMLKSFAGLVVAHLIKLTVSEVIKYVGKFIPVGGAIFGRRYALVLTTSDKPPAGHPRAWLLAEVTKPEWGMWFYLWGVSFPKGEWENLPESLKVKLP